VRSIPPAGDDLGEKEKKGYSCGWDNQSGAKAMEVSGKYTGQPRKYCSSHRGTGKEDAKPLVISGAGKHERNQERKDRSKGKPAENR